jgi:CDP-ribitol ribitolphosphotransferase
LTITAKNVFTCPEFSSLELLTMTDYLITDYSAIALEAAVLDVKTLYYLRDYKGYIADSGVNIDLYCEMPCCVFESATILSKVLSERYPTKLLERYKQRFLPEPGIESTEAIIDLIIHEGALACSS